MGTGLFLFPSANEKALLSKYRNIVVLVKIQYLLFVPRIYDLK